MAANPEIGDQQFRDLVEGSFLGIYVHRHGKPLFANQKLAEIFGYDSPKEILDLDTIMDLAAPHERARLWQIASTRAEGQDALSHYEYQGRRRDGSTIWIDNMVRMVTWDGEPAIQASVIDITARKKIEATLRRERGFSDAMLDTIDALVVVLDREGKIIRFNHACERATGYSAQDVQGTAIWDVVIPEAIIEPVKQVFQALRSGQVPNRHENAWVAMDGSRRLISWSNTAILDDQGDVAFIIGTGLDITRHRQAEDDLKESEAKIRRGHTLLEQTEDRLSGIERRYRALFQQRVALAGVCDPDGTLVDANLASLSYVGTTREDVLGRPFWTTPWWLHDQEQQIRLRRAIEQAAAGRRVRFDATHPRSDGTLGQVDFSVVPILDETGSVETLLIESIDVTEQRALQQQLLQAQKMEAVGQLTGGIAHDFNNLLTVIIGNLEMLEMQLVDDEATCRSVAQAQKAAERAARLTSHLLAFARRQPLEPKALQLNEAIVDMEGLLHSTMGDSVQISMSLAKGLGNTMVDPTQLQNALLNLALNARDAMPEGGKLTIETANVEFQTRDAMMPFSVAAGSYVTLSVSDTGTGMTAETRERVFEPFFTTKETGAGSGLGLSMVYGFTKQSGGYVQLESEPERGTTVRLYLPQTDEDADEQKIDESGLPLGRGETILVVEDDPLVRSVTVTRLQELGYTVLEADCGPAALDLLQQSSSIDLLFTDLLMPGGMTGRDLARRVEHRYPDAKVLFTSGYADKISELGLNITRLSKPYKRRELAQSVRAVLDS